MESRNMIQLTTSNFELGKCYKNRFLINSEYFDYTVNKELVEFEKSKTYIFLLKAQSNND